MMQWQAKSGRADYLISTLPRHLRQYVSQQEVVEIMSQHDDLTLRLEILKKAKKEKERRER